MRTERVYRSSRYNRADLKYTYRENIENQPTTLKRLVNGEFVRWSDQATFPAKRFNPDHIPEPLIPGVRAAA